jgi:hypothetical protein
MMRGVPGAQWCDCQCHPDWSWLRFGDSNIHPTDVDGLFVVERARRFLFVEWKPPEAALTEGQRFLLEALSRVRDLSSACPFTVLVVRGPRGEPMQVQRVERGCIGKPEMTDRRAFQKRVDVWYTAVNGGPMNGKA